jgi:hypothetical protein
LAFLTQNKGKLCKILIITLVFEKNANFFAENWRKWQKNCDHNIDPWSPELLRVEQGRNEERSREGDEKDGRRGAEAVLAELQRRADDDGHHDERVCRRQDARQQQLPARLAGEADCGVDDDGDLEPIS